VTSFYFYISYHAQTSAIFQYLKGNAANLSLYLINHLSLSGSWQWHHILSTRSVG